jgi:3-hydroxyacyl-CoA dehydrogenase
VDFIATEGLKFPHGPLAEIDERGAGAVLRDLQTVNAAIPGNPMKPPELLTAMAREGQPFFKTGQVNPWITSLVEGTTHARH